MGKLFHRLSSWAANGFGSPWAFMVALVFLITWGVSGPIFGFSDTWQLVANTVTSVVTFLMVFVIQNSQNRDSKAIQLKLAELIRATHGTRNAMVTLEDLSDEEIARLHREFEKLSQNKGTEPLGDVSEIAVEDLTLTEKDDRQAQRKRMHQLCAMQWNTHRQNGRRRRESS